MKLKRNTQPPGVKDTKLRARMARLGTAAAAGATAVTLSACSAPVEPVPDPVPAPGNCNAQAAGTASVKAAASVFSDAAADGKVSTTEWRTSVKDALEDSPCVASGASREVARHHASHTAKTGTEIRAKLGAYLNSRGYDVRVSQPRTAATSKALYEQMVDSNVTERDAFYEKLDEGTPNNNKVGVAVLDDGFDLGHPAFEGRLHTNSGEIRNGRDDDGDGLRDNVHGADFAQGDGNPHSPATSGGHGSHTMGSAGAGTKDIETMPIRVFQPFSGQATAAAVDYAAAKGAKVMNMSFSVQGAGGVAPIIAAIARHPDVLFTVAAANDGRDLSSYPEGAYLARNQLPNMMVVGAGTAEGKPAYYTNFGKPWTTHADRGSDVRSAVPGGGYKEMSGTSMAAPNAANAAAKVELLDPKLTAVQIRGILTDTTVRSGDWVDLVNSGGLIDEDAASAVAKITSLVRSGTDAVAASRTLGLSEDQRERVLWVASRYLPAGTGASAESIREELAPQASKVSPEAIVDAALRSQVLVGDLLDDGKDSNNVDPLKTLREG